MDFNYFHSMSHFYTTDNAKNIRFFFCMEHWFKIGGVGGGVGGQVGIIYVQKFKL